MANNRFSAEGNIFFVIEECNTFLKNNKGREPKAITVGGNGSYTMTIAFTLKPKSGTKVWEFRKSTNWDTLDVLASKETAVVFEDDIAYFVGVA